MRSALPLLALGVALAAGAVVAVPAPASAAISTGATEQLRRAMRAVHGYSGEQLTNAAVIVAVAQRLGLGREGAVLGVMTAMGESSLRNLDHGDGAINPDGTVADSVGLFQQQHWWGTLVERRTPAVAAARFFVRLRVVPHWRDLAPTAAAHAVQRNADPDFYTRFLPAAQAVVDAVEPAASAALLTHSGSALRPSAQDAGTAARTARKQTERSAERFDVAVPDLTALPDLPELADVPEFDDVAAAGFGDAVLDELQRSGVALPAEPGDAAR